MKLQLVLPSSGRLFRCLWKIGLKFRKAIGGREGEGNAGRGEERAVGNGHRTKPAPNELYPQISASVSPHQRSFFYSRSR